MTPKMIKQNFLRGLWSWEMVATATKKKGLNGKPILSEEAFKDIMTAGVERGRISPDDYAEITGEAYLQ